MCSTNKISLIQFTACLAGGWALAQWLPVSQRSDGEANPDARSQPVPIALTSEQRAIDEGDLGERAILYAASKRTDFSDADRATLKFATWAERDPRAAIDAAFKYEPESERSEAIGAAVRTVAEKDAALALERCLPHLEAVTEDPILALSYLSEVTIIFDQYGKQDVWAAVRSIEELPEFMFEGSGAGFGSGGGGGFPGQHSFPQPKLALVAAEAVAEHWPVAEIAKKVRWSAELFVEEEDDWRYIDRLVGPPSDGWDSLGEGTATLILSEVSQIEDVLARDLALLTTIREAGEQVGRQAVAKLSDARRGTGLALLAPRISDPLEAIAFVGEHWDEFASSSSLKATPESVLDTIQLSGDPFSDVSDVFVPTERLLDLPAAAQRHLLDRWVRVSDAGDDPFTFVGGGAPTESVLKMVESLPPGEVMNAAAVKLTGSWAYTDAVAASEWVSRLPQDAAHRDVVIGELVRTIADDDPQAATAWADSINDPDWRERFLRVALRHWSASDPVEAEVAIRAAELSEAARGSLLDRLTPPEKE